MTYVSPFDELISPRHFETAKSNQEYEGTVDALVDETLRAAQAPETTLEHLIPRICFPPRLIRAAINYKIQGDPSYDRFDYVVDTVNIGQAIYRRDANASEAVRALGEKIQRRTPDFLGEVIRQPADAVTWESAHASKSRESARNVYEKTRGERVLFIALAHGGIAAGLDVFLRYDACAQENSIFYPIRFSRDKCRDTSPHVNSREKYFLQRSLRGRTLVLFDEDIHSGTTLRRAEVFLRKMLKPKRMWIVTNRDRYAKLKPRIFDTLSHLSWIKN